MRFLRGFLMGVLGWTPQTTMRESSLEDIRDALTGFAHYQGHGQAVKARPSPDNMKKMMAQFPDVVKTQSDTGAE